MKHIVSMCVLMSACNAASDMSRLDRQGDVYSVQQGLLGKPAPRQPVIRVIHPGEQGVGAHIGCSRGECACDPAYAQWCRDAIACENKYSCWSGMSTEQQAQNDWFITFMCTCDV